VELGSNILQVRPRNQAKLHAMQRMLQRSATSQLRRQTRWRLGWAGPDWIAPLPELAYVGLQHLIGVKASPLAVADEVIE
jgi:hypothetical protein